MPLQILNLVINRDEKSEKHTRVTSCLSLLPDGIIVCISFYKRGEGCCGYEAVLRQKKAFMIQLISL